MMDSTRFWSRFLAAYLGEGSPEPFDGDISDWTAVVERGRDSHLLELVDVYRKNDPGGGETHFPETLLRTARETRTRTTYRNRLFRDLIHEIDDASKSSHCRFAWLKGAVRLRQNRCPTGGRRLSDLDLLVHPEDLRPFHELLTGLGYEAHRDPDWITGDGFSQSVASTFFTKEYRGMKVLVDLHWHLTDYPARRYCGQWDYSLEPVWKGVADRTMRPEHRLIYTIDHAFTHNFTYWKFLPDLHDLLQTHELNWDVVRRELGRTNLGFVLALFGAFCSEFFPTVHTPETIRQMVRELPDRYELSDAEKQYVTRSTNGNCADSDYLTISLNRLPTVLQQVLFLRYILLPPVEAVPMVRSDSGPVETGRLYLRRLGRVLGRGLSKLGGVNGP